MGIPHSAICNMTGLLPGIWGNMTQRNVEIVIDKIAELGKSKIQLGILFTYGENTPGDIVHIWRKSYISDIDKRPNK